MIAVMRGLVVDAQTSGQVGYEDTDAATFLILSTNTAVITAQRISSDVGVAPPDRHSTVRFCLGGLQADVASIDLVALDERIVLPEPAPRARRAAVKPKAKAKPKPKKRPSAK